MSMHIRIWLLAAVLAAAPATAAAQCAIPARVATADEASEELRQLQVADCLGGIRCSVPNCAQFTAWRAAPDAKGAVELLTAIRNSAAAVDDSENLRRLVQRIDAWIEVVGADAVVNSEPGHWRYDQGGGGLFLGTPYAIEVEAGFESRCAAGADACSAVFAEAVEIVTDAALVERINGVLLTDLRVKIVEYVTALDKRWEDYFNKSPSQFPWELAINSARFRRHEKRGYNEPPASQLIILHPSAAFAYASAGEDRLRSALVLEAVGYFARGFGGSVGAVWTDRQDQRKVGYAILAHWGNKISVGAAYHGGSRDPSILMSAHVEKFLTGNAKKVRDVLTKVR
ncbi:MAG: hypothetical protein ABIP09_07410 [Gemmatimonadaceae bacterium]